jgi:hypothetical protein
VSLEDISPHQERERHRLTYLAAPYTHPDPAVLQQRYIAANRACAELMRQGPVFSPISHSHPVADYMDPALRLDHHFWQEQDTAILCHCSRVVVLKLDGWRESKGIAAELKLARKCGIPVEFMEPVDPTGTCPCRYTSPCDPSCTCVNPFSSRGCARCCSYGSLDQRQRNAERLARMVEP